MIESILPHVITFDSLTLGLLPTLGADYIGIIVFVVAVLLTVGGWIMNAIKKFKENAQVKRQRQQLAKRAERSSMRIDGRGDDDDEELEEIEPASSMTSKERLDALATRRRAQMAKTRAQSGRPMAGASSEPDNLSAAQRAARDRAKQAYERRAELLARQRQALQQAQQQAAQQNTQRAQPVRQSNAMANAKSALGQQQANVQANKLPTPKQARQQIQQQAITRRAQAKAAAAAADRARAAAQSPAELAARSRRVKRTGPLEVEKIQGRATINDDSLEVVKTRQQKDAIDANGLRRALTGKSIRAAFVLKEVLDRPIALRQAEDQPGTLNFK